MRSILIALGLAVSSTCGFAAGGIPSGKLGFPLGTYLTVEGTAAKVGFKVNPTCTLIVDTINGKRLDQPVSIVVERAGMPLPQEGRIVVRGYESGKMIGTPPAEIDAAKDAGKEITIPQAAWQFYRFFILTSWIEPKTGEKHRDQTVEQSAAPLPSAPGTGPSESAR